MNSQLKSMALMLVLLGSLVVDWARRDQLARALSRVF